MRGVLLQILIERHGLEHHLLMQLRGIQQVKPIVFPYRKAEVRDVEPRLFAGDGDDIAVVDGLAQLLAVANGRFGNIAKLLARHLLFHLADIADKLRMLLQSLVALRVLAHVVDTDLLKGREGRIGSLYLMDDARLGVLGNPLGEIMDAAGIAPDEPPR